MDGKQHSKGFKFALYFFIPLFIAVSYLFDYRWIFYIPLLINSNSVVDCDEDQKWQKGKYHRSFLTHSIFWSLNICGSIILTIYPYLPTDMLLEWGLRLFAVFTIPVILHLSLDIYSPSGHRVGKYLIRRLNGKRLSATQTVIWFVLNILIMLVIDAFIFL